MLAAAAVAVWLVFLLAIELGRRVAGAPAFPAVLLLIVSPLFYTQAMMAQLDMPAMLLTVLALLLFLQDRVRSAALACVALVLVKETGLIAPLVFARLADRGAAPPRGGLVPPTGPGAGRLARRVAPRNRPPFRQFGVCGIQPYLPAAPRAYRDRAGAALLLLVRRELSLARLARRADRVAPDQGLPGPALAYRGNSRRGAGARGHGARRRGAGTLPVAGAAADVYRLCGRVVRARVRLEPRRAGGDVCGPCCLPVLEPSLPISVREQSRHGGFRAAAARRCRLCRAQLPGRNHYNRLAAFDRAPPAGLRIRRLEAAGAGGPELSSWRMSANSIQPPSRSSCSSHATGRTPGTCGGCPSSSR